MARTYTSTHTEKIARTPGTASFRFIRPAGYTYAAGQWFVLTIPGPTGPLSKHFTHSSAPTEPHLEFTTRLTGSPYKTAMEQLPLGTEVEIEGPFGSFVLPEDRTRTAFLAGGIGVTPVRSILRDLADRQAAGQPLPDRDLAVFYGNQSPHTIVFADEFEAFARALPRLKVVHVLSEPGDDWAGWRGYLRGEILEAELADPASWRYAVSGPPAMVEAMRSLLRERNIPRRQLVFESFEGYQ
ncbi:MAG: hypothetical protein Kow00122_02060 [Thermoleophilia bacterium]